MKFYLGNQWKKKSDIASAFGIKKKQLKGCKIYLAYYHVGDWGCDSSAYVLFEKDGKLWEVHGSHCSCYGLGEQGYSGDTSTQWEPEITNIAYLQKRVNGEEALGYVGGYDEKGYRKESKKIVKHLVSLNRFA